MINYILYFYILIFIIDFIIILLTIINMINIDYSNISRQLTKKITKNEKKENGIFFTNPNKIIKIINILKPYIKNIKTVLEPSCGSCEFINLLDKNYKNLNITGIELNKTIYNSIKFLENNNIKLINENFLTYNFENKYNLIIGNPPYFVIKKNLVNKYYYKYFEGRPNIFILFLIKSLSLLDDNGILAFVLPKSFLNCLYYDNTRKYIINNFKIIDIIDVDDNYIETKQQTIIFILQKISDTNLKIINTKYVIDKDKYTIILLNKDISILKNLYKNSTTLKDLGFKISVGNITWNQCKKELTNDTNKTLLIYSSDIKNKKLEIKKYSNIDKKNYINKKGNNDLIIVMNRGYGVGNYNFDYCLIDVDYDYLVENHLICIKYTKDIDKKNLKILYNKILNSFDNEKTQQFIKLYFGNNAINTTELYEILPIYY